MDYRLVPLRWDRIGYVRGVYVEIMDGVYQWAEFYEDKEEWELYREMVRRSVELDVGDGDGWFICDDRMMGEFVSAFWKCVTGYSVEEMGVLAEDGELV